MAISLRTLKPPNNLFISAPQSPKPLNAKPISVSFSNKAPKTSIKASYFNVNNSNYNSFNGEDNLLNQQEPLQHPRPSDIPWNKEICNSVHLIGVVGTPVQVKHFDSGKVLAWTRLAVKKSATDTSWINLTFWNDLAYVASQHVEKGQRIYVSGRLVSDTVEGDFEKPQTYYKVVVQQLNFIEKSSSQEPHYDQGRNSTSTGGRGGNYPSKSTVSTQELWQAFFANPLDWWDNRKNKRNPKYPDFKHKDTGEALWVEGKNNPPWAKSQLAVLDSRMESFDGSENDPPVSYVSSDDLTLF